MKIKLVPLKKHVFDFSPKHNSGEGLTLTTEFFDNGDAAKGLKKGFFVHQELQLRSYSNSTSIFLSNIPLIPETLRKLANELEMAENELKANLNLARTREE